VTLRDADTHEGRGDIVGEFLCNDGETGCEKGGISHGFDYANQEGEHDELVVFVNSVQQPASLHHRNFNNVFARLQRFFT
jgi:hypothetical protein